MSAAPTTRAVYGDRPEVIYNKKALIDFHVKSEDYRSVEEVTIEMQRKGVATGNRPFWGQSGIRHRPRSSRGQRCGRSVRRCEVMPF